MATQHTAIFHCQKCGKLIYEECGPTAPECCGHEMTRAVDDVIWELDEKDFKGITPKARKFLRSIQGDHRKLIKQFLAVRDSWNILDDPRSSDYATIRKQLTSLREQLAEHFTDEEQGGYLHQALSAAPRLRQQAAELAGQHKCFLECLDRLSNNLRAEEAESWKEARSDFGQLVIDLQKHEGAENMLLQDAFTSDLGIGD